MEGQEEMSKYKGLFTFDEYNHRYVPIAQADGIIDSMDYKPAEPLIKDEKIRKAVRAWADYHNTNEVKCYIGTWDHAGICLPDSVLQLHSIRDRIVIQFFMDADKREKIKEGKYTIAELCGEEE